MIGMKTIVLLLVSLAASPAAPVWDVSTTFADGTADPFSLTGLAFDRIEYGQAWVWLDGRSGQEKTLTISLSDGGLMSAARLEMSNIWWWAGTGIDVWLDGILSASVPCCVLWSGGIDLTPASPFAAITLSTAAPNGRNGVFEHMTLDAVYANRPASEVPEPATGVLLAVMLGIGAAWKLWKATGE